MLALLVTNLEYFMGFSLSQTIGALEFICVTRSLLFCPFLLTFIYVTDLELSPFLL